MRGPICAYSPSYHRTRQGDNIVNVILDIMDDGPKPMRDFRPARGIQLNLPNQKSRNGAERFNYEHQEEYEARGRQDRDRVSIVHQHNTAYPKLKDELDKKRSAINTNVLSTECAPAPVSPAKRRPYTKRGKVQNSRSKKRDNRSRITKPMSKTRRKRPSPYRLCQMNKCCQCLPLSKKNAATSDVSFALVIEPSQCSNQSDTMASTPDAEMNNINDDIDLNNYGSGEDIPRQYSRESFQNASVVNEIPDPSEPSISTYNSFVSMDHEPMVDRDY